MSALNNKTVHKVEVGGGSVDIKGTLVAEHQLHWDDKSWTLSGVFLTLWGTIFFGLCSLNELHWGLNIPISAALVFGLFLIIWRLRRYMLRSLRSLDRAFRFKETYYFNNKV